MTDPTDRSTDAMPDPVSDKDRVKDQIADALDRRLDVDREQIEQRVEEEYESILDGAAVTDHVPVLTIGKINQQFRNARSSADAEEEWQDG